MSSNPTKNKIWLDLQSKAKEIKKTPIRDLFTQDDKRFDNMTI